MHDIHDATQPNPTTPTMAALLIDETEARRLLGGLSPKSMFNLRRSGSLPHLKVGARVLYEPSALASWIRAQAHTNEARP